MLSRISCAGRAYLRKLRREIYPHACTKPATGDALRCCSRECGWALARTPRVGEYRQGDTCTLAIKTCSCGKVFTSRRGRITCSEECTIARLQHGTHTRRTALGILRRREVLRGSTLGLDQILKRDGKRCWICKMKTLIGMQGLHPLAATLDHVIPVSKGGLHVAENLRIAHRCCNIVKSARKLTGSVKVRASNYAVRWMVDLAWLKGAGVDSPVGGYIN